LPGKHRGSTRMNFVLFASHALAVTARVLDLGD
jgi:hypothetical protein